MAKKKAAKKAARSVGPKPVVLIEFDVERDTVSRLGMPDAHRPS